MFFEQINRIMGRDADLILTIRKTNDSTLTVAAHTRMNGLEDEAQHYIAPFTASGSPHELDTDFVSALTGPITHVQGLLINMKQYEKQLETARANSKAEKERKEKEAKEAKEHKEICERHLKKADEQTAEGKYADALINLRQARLHATEEGKKKIDTQIRAVQAKASQGTLFGAAMQRPAQSPLQSRPQPVPAVRPAEPPASAPSYVEEDAGDPYGEFVDFPEECRAKDPCHNMDRDTLF